MQAAPLLAANSAGEPAVECQGIWKIFAEEQDAIRRVLEQRIGKDEALAEHGAVVAVSDATFSVSRGEIFCIMGLSGSGKSTLVRQISVNAPLG